ncbi:Nif3-like dinuclear metal center hexameric protein [Capnocytophaga catalasegens]|uniref:GTP cyclohydrolase 1 type 2 homolog n=1 Tax=Capnocytophaga catalasegens TaxID=1004260 RepID=A0AAV5ATV2_9FLAO|nr:Nif3-like dinuclear metal center hexameric protein [Capnocytophaga catalasegens]GIZ15195.1 GTP cyclohydrolase 1 type 2 [Capnocytophaga catalasegens]GJM49710.1 GTP cyclohydrolase 1 type 2 [Capnocytophaga catalasegens]GJM52775.1 GTP cyclohydrolase 1 type 2 [Capnocytophaga catalasegens]
MNVQNIIDFFEEISPLAYAESFDNIGLLVGNPSNKVSGILITLDTTECVVAEAIEKKCNLIVSFHPIIFNGVKKLTGETYVERAVIKAIRHDIAIYAIHTALDNSFWGVNARICEILGLSTRKILIPQRETLQKLITFVPENQAEILRKKLFEAGAGNIGNYSDCSFNLSGVGTFKGNEHSNPVIGEKNILHHEKETQIGIIFPKHVQNKVLEALFKNHPYEEVAYEIYTLKNTHQHIGLGMLGELSQVLSEIDFLQMLKDKMQTDCIRYSAFTGKPIKKVAVLGGSGAFAIGNAIKAQADAFVTADVKYHEFFQAENKILIADIGHYESEQFTKNLLFEKLTKKFPNFAPVLIAQNTNPIKYL